MKRDIPNNKKKPLGFWDKVKGFRMVGNFIAIKVETLHLPLGDWRWIGTQKYSQYAYYCPDCGLRLSAGPRGGAACNCVCHNCRINFGTLPNNEHE